MRGMFGIDGLMTDSIDLSINAGWKRSYRAKTI